MNYEITVNKPTCYEKGNGFEADATVQGQPFKVYLQLPDTSDSQHSTLDGSELSSEVLSEIASLAEDSFESYLDMYVAGNITSGSYFEKRIGVEGLGNFYLIADAAENDPVIHLVGKDEGYSSHHQKPIYGEVDINDLEEKQLEAIQEEIKIFKKENNIIEPEFKIGDAVWFTDPDNNEDSGWYKITGIVDDGSIAIFYIENEYNSDIEAYSHELSDEAPDPITIALDFANGAYNAGELRLNEQLPMGDRGDGLADFIVNELNDVLKGETDPQVIQEIIRNALGLSVRQLKGVINDICDSPALEEALNNKPIHSEELDIFQLVLDIANQAYEKGELCLNEPLENRDLGDGLADFIVNELKEVSLISLFWLMDVTEPEVIQEAVRNALESAVQQIENVIEGTSDNPDFEQLLIDRQNNPYRPGVEALNDSIKASEPGAGM